MGNLSDTFFRRAVQGFGELIGGQPGRSLGNAIYNGNPTSIITTGERILRGQSRPRSNTGIDVDNDGNNDITSSGNLVDSDRDGIPDYQEPGNSKYYADRYTGNRSDLNGDGRADRNRNGDLYDRNRNMIPDYQEVRGRRDYTDYNTDNRSRYPQRVDQGGFRSPDIRENDAPSLNPRYTAARPPIAESGAVGIVRNMEGSLDVRDVPIVRKAVKGPDKDTKTIQAGLTLMGIDVGKIDGDEGPATRRGIQAYAQKNPDLHLDPNDRAAVLAAIQNDLRTDPDVQTRMATIIGEGRNANKNDARAVQAALNEMGARLDVDGSIGRKTIQAYNDAMDQNYTTAAPGSPGLPDVSPASNIPPVISSDDTTPVRPAASPVKWSP